MGRKQRKREQKTRYHREFDSQSKRGKAKKKAPGRKVK
jgi:hypothetical protein